MFRPECSTGTKRGTKFNNIKDPVKKSHQQDVGYYAACPEPGCAEDYIGETGRRLNERVIYHNGRYKKSHLYKHSQESNHPCVALSDFEIIGSNFQNQKFKRKIAESLLIREKRSSLNTQEISIPLKLFLEHHLSIICSKLVLDKLEYHLYLIHWAL